MRSLFLVYALLYLAVSTAAQTAAASDPAAVALATKSITALTAGLPVTDVALSANVIWIAGSDNLTGTGTLRAKGLAESRVDLTLGSTTRSEIRTVTAGYPEGAWTKNASARQTISLHNCFTDAVWFFPALSSLSQTVNANFVFSYVGAEKHAGVSTLHIKAFHTLSQDTKAILMADRLSAMDFYFDPISTLPIAIAFKVHPDDDLNADIPMEIRYADYRSINGIEVPFHVQRLLNGGAVLDVVVTNAVVNSGLTDTLFNVQ